MHPFMVSLISSTSPTAPAPSLNHTHGLQPTRSWPASSWATRILHFRGVLPLPGTLLWLEVVQELQPCSFPMQAQCSTCCDLRADPALSRTLVWTPPQAPSHCQDTSQGSFSPPPRTACTFPGATSPKSPTELPVPGRRGQGASPTPGLFSAGIPELESPRIITPSRAGHSQVPVGVPEPWPGWQPREQRLCPVGRGMVWLFPQHLRAADTSQSPPGTAPALLPSSQISSCSSCSFLLASGAPLSLCPEQAVS